MFSVSDIPLCIASPQDDRWWQQLPTQCPSVGPECSMNTQLGDSALLLVNLGFLMGHIHMAEIREASVLYTETDVP